jgi:hypothetical protein
MFRLRHLTLLLMLASAPCVLGVGGSPASADDRLVRLRDQTRALLAVSARQAPDAFQVALTQLAARVNHLNAEPLIPLDMSRVRGKSYGTYDMHIWLVRENSLDLQAAALVWSSPQSPLYGNKATLALAGKVFDYVLAHFTPDGTIGGPEANIDRFIYVPLWESYILFGPDLPAGQRARLTQFFTQAARHQLQTYGAQTKQNEGKPGFHPGTYPNMDAAYLLIETQAAVLTGRAEFADEAKGWISHLAAAIHGSVYDYIKGWNESPGYTQVVLDFVGRYYQLTHDPEALRQIGLHADYYAHFIEPSGWMDYGMPPFIKHDWYKNTWNFDTYSGCLTGLELVNAVSGTPATAYLVQQERAAVKSKTDVRDATWLLYWMGPVHNPAAPSASFCVASPAIDGWQARSTTPDGTITFYATGRVTAVDTRVSAVVSPAAHTGLKPSAPSALAGVNIVAVSHGEQYFIGDMAPTVDTAVSPEGKATKATLTISEGRHGLGPEVETMALGDPLRQVRFWKHDAWKGGSPDGPPVAVSQTWTAAGGRLEGEIAVTATADCTLDAVRLNVVPTQVPSEARSAGTGEISARCEALCMRVESLQGPWTARLNPWHLRIDAPAGKYNVTLTAGDPAGVTEPFAILANGEQKIQTAAVPRGTFAKFTFQADSVDGYIGLAFVPLRPGANWKLRAIELQPLNSLASHTGWQVGPANQPPPAGWKQLSGSMVYTPARGIGWFGNLDPSEQQYRGPNGVQQDVIICPDVRTALTLSDQTGAPRAWKAGDTMKARVQVWLASQLTAVPPATQ